MPLIKIVKSDHALTWAAQHLAITVIVGFGFLFDGLSWRSLMAAS